MNTYIKLFDKNLKEYNKIIKVIDSIEFEYSTKNQIISYLTVINNIITIYYNNVNFRIKQYKKSIGLNIFKYEKLWKFKQNSFFLIKDLDRRYDYLNQYISDLIDDNFIENCIKIKKLL